MVTAGLRRAPLRRPTGDKATIAARIPNTAPISTSRSTAEGRASFNGERELSRAAMAVKPRNRKKNVPTSSHSHSIGCHPPVFDCVGAASVSRAWDGPPLRRAPLNREGLHRLRDRRRLSSLKPSRDLLTDNP